MCAVDDADELVQILTDEDRKARKPHKCGECHREIRIGETYHYESGIFDGTMVDYRTCLHCMRCRQYLINECSGFIFEGVEEDLAEHASGYKDMSLYRLVVGMRRKWQRFDGKGLMANPA